LNLAGNPVVPGGIIFAGDTYLEIFNLYDTPPANNSRSKKKARLIK
jgi:hypothetical protein